MATLCDVAPISYAPAHFEAPGQVADRGFQSLPVDPKIGQIETNTLEKLVGRRIGMLI